MLVRYFVKYVPLMCECTVWVVVPDLGHFLFHVTGFVCKGEVLEQKNEGRRCFNDN